MNPWNFSCRTTIQVGRGSRSRLPALVRELGHRVLVLTGARHLDEQGVWAALSAAFDQQGLVIDRMIVDHEPDCALVDALTARARVLIPEVVVAIGGGSVLDAAKAVAALVTNPGVCEDYLEALPQGGGRPLQIAPLPVVACPTTAGTGCEVTRNAVIQAERFQVKRSLRHEALAPVQAVIDPDLLQPCPLTVSAAAAFDCLAHLVEAWCSTAASPMTDALARTGLPVAVGFLRSLVAGTRDPAQDEAMAVAACWGGLCLANARLGAAHGLVAPLGARLGLGHGRALACLLPATLLVNQDALRQRQPASPVLARLEEMAQLIVGRPDLGAAVQELSTWRQHLGLSSLSAAGLSADLIPGIAASPSTSINTNPIVLSPEECARILILAG